MEKLKKVGFVVCSRSDSKRIPYKPFQKIEDSTVIELLLDRLADCRLETYLAVPECEIPVYRKLLCEREKLTIVGAFGDDPLARMQYTAKMFDLDIIIRICHDKIFIDRSMLFQALRDFEKYGYDYLYSSSCIDGTHFEIIRANVLEKASIQFKKVEHVSYAIRAVTQKNKIYDYPFFMEGPRLLIDYPEDLTLMRELIRRLGKGSSLSAVVEYWKTHKDLFFVNKLPEITVYTCAYNAERYLDQCINSVLDQNIINRCEYIIVDDCSIDGTRDLINKYSRVNNTIKFLPFSKNKGLAAASNVALKHARGKYIIRLDADDFFHTKDIIQHMYVRLSASGKDALYPNNYFGTFEKIQKGKEHHHIGGAMFRTRAMNAIKFTDGLRGYEGLDFFERARDQLEVSYFDYPAFFYRQHEESLTKNNGIERENIKKKIEAGKTGLKLCQ